MDSPKAMQNSSTSMLVSSGSAVKCSSPDRCPSWKIHTISPAVAARVTPLSTRERIGCTTDPVNRNSTMNVVSTMSSPASGSRLPIACVVSISSAVWPPT